MHTARLCQGPCLREQPLPHAHAPPPLRTRTPKRGPPQPASQHGRRVGDTLRAASRASLHALSGGPPHAGGEGEGALAPPRADMTPATREPPSLRAVSTSTTANHRHHPWLKNSPSATLTHATLNLDTRLIEGGGA